MGMGAAVAVLAVGDAGIVDGGGVTVGAGSATMAVGSGAVGMGDGGTAVCAPPPHALNNSNSSSADPRRTRN